MNEQRCRQLGCVTATDPISFLLVSYRHSGLACCSTLTEAQVVRIGWRLRLAKLVPCLLPGLQCNKRRVLVANYDIGATPTSDVADACFLHLLERCDTELFCDIAVRW